MVAFDAFEEGNLTSSIAALTHLLSEFVAEQVKVHFIYFLLLEFFELNFPIIPLISSEEVDNNPLVQFHLVA